VVRKKHNAIIKLLPRYGCIATGILYGSIGIIAILSFMKLKDGGADESRLMAWLNQYTIGKILVFIILAGSLCYIIWRFYEAVTDPYGYGKSAGGISKRIGIALSTVADIMIVASAFKYLLMVGNTSEEDQLPMLRQMVGDLLQKQSGEVIIFSAGAIILITAVVQLIYGITRGYHERLEVEEFRPAMRETVHFWGITGYIARGIIIGITGWFYISAAITGDAGRVVDTDKAFDFIGDNVGHAPFIIVAAGTIFYGLFMLALGAAYDIDHD
jgi:hypothetical protein